MRRFIPYIAFGFLLLAAWSCTRNDEPDTLSTNQGKIIIKTALDSQVVTRAADNNDSQVELKITRIDLFVVDPTGDYLIDHREHYEAAEGESLNDVTLEDGEGTLTLSGKDRNAFSPNKEYHIYLVANAPEAVAAKLESTTKVTKLSDLTSLMYEEVTSETTYLHLSGTGEANAPETFLMDAVGTVSKDDTSRGIVLYDGNSTNNTNIYAEFKRAAAKVVVNIKQGAAVEFMREILLTTEEHGVSASGKSQYVFYNLPVKTAVLAEGGDNITFDNNHLIETNLVTIPSESGKNRPTFSWADGVGSVGVDGKGEVKIQIIGYAYAHNWYQQSTINFEPSLLLNLPMWWDADNKPETSGMNKDGKEAPRPGNWYKIPLSQEKKFERNTCYIVNLTINAVGAESKSEAIELDDIDYDTRPWDDITINVGDNSTRPTYLKLNTDVVKMYNTNIDTDQLIFSSSSPITSIVLTDVYKQNADGTFVKVGEKDENGNTIVADGHKAYYLNKYSVNRDLSSSITSAISATAEDGKLNGNITIVSPIGPDVAQMNAAIAQLEKPVHPGEPPVEPEGFVENAPSAPDPIEYIRGQETTEGAWSGSDSDHSGTQTRTVTLKRYRYNSETGMFQYQTGTRTDTREYRDIVIWDYWRITEGDEKWIGDWIDYENDEYNAKVSEYTQLLALWNVSKDNPEHNTYREKLVAYRALLDTYNTQMADYNEAVADIEATMGEGVPETHYNSVRYLEFLVTNGDNLTATFRVEQYPTIFVKNIVGWYSYRDDFFTTAGNKPTSYKYKGDRIVGISYNSSSATYTKNTSSSGFWRSKVNRDANGSNHSNATSFDIDYYSWNSSDNNSPSNFGDAENDNARMYHITVTTTSAQYTVGRPTIIDADGNPTNDVENGVTDPSTANSKLVSPSFMTASRLGFVNTGNGTLSLSDNAASLALVREHCKNYVEVAADGTEYHDWRLPTASEIQLIINLQSRGSSDATVAIDFLLNANNYFSASGPVANSKGTSSGTSVRCVRDAYNDNKAAKTNN